MVDLKRDLVRGADMPAGHVHTNDPDPSYLRIAVLNRFNGNEWSPGDRTSRAASAPTARCRARRA